MRSLAAIPLLAWGVCAAQWYQMPDFPGTPRDDAAAFALDDKVYVGTGMEVGWGLTNDWYAFSLITESWAPSASLPASGRQYCSAFKLDNDLGYLFGGVDANGPLNELWSYDAQTNSWIQRAPLPGPGRYACTVLVFDVQAFVCGGMLEGGIATNEVWRYDRITDAWTQRNPMPGPGRHRAAGMYLHVIGGADSSFQALDDVQYYDHTNDEWHTRPPLPEPRFGASVGEPMLFCGASSLSENHDTVLLMDDNSGNWSSAAIPGFPGGPRKGGVAAALPLGTKSSAHFFGLGIDGPTRHNDWWMFFRSTGMAEHGAALTRVFPNPAGILVAIDLPAHWPHAACIVRDALGRNVREQVVPQGSSLNVGGLPAGRYELLVRYGDELLRAPLIKSP